MDEILVCFSNNKTSSYFSSILQNNFLHPVNPGSQLMNHNFLTELVSKPNTNSFLITDMF